MKKLFSVILALLMLSSIAVIAQDTPTKEVENYVLTCKNADFNGDGKINKIDTRVIRRVMAQGDVIDEKFVRKAYAKNKNFGAYLRFLLSQGNTSITLEEFNRVYRTIARLEKTCDSVDDNEGKDLTVDDLTVRGSLIANGKSYLRNIYSKGDLSLNPNDLLLIKSDGIVIKDNAGDKKLTIDAEPSFRGFRIESIALKIIGRQGLVLDSDTGYIQNFAPARFRKGFVTNEDTVATFDGTVRINGPLSVLSIGSKFKSIAVQDSGDFGHLYTRSIESDVTKTGSLWVDQEVMLSGLANPGNVGFACISGQGELFRSENPCDEF